MSMALAARAPTLRRHQAIAVSLLLLGCAIMAVLSLTTGSYDLHATEIWDAMLGRSDRIGRLVVVGLRLPRIVAALAVGAALGVAGKIFQSLCRNPLASPDLVGFTTGSATGALVAILLLGQSAAGIASGALAGGCVAAAAVYVLTLRRGLKGERFILTGIAISAMLAAFDEYLITRADLEKAEAAKTWMFGSLAGAAWPQVEALVPAILALLILAVLAWPALRMLEMGDELATGLGLAASRSRLMLMGIGIALAGLATALAGPVHFLALAAPPLARGLVRPADAGVCTTAAMGALLLLVGDFLAQHLMAPFQIPVGLVTGAIGGAYLILLLTRSRKGGER